MLRFDHGASQQGVGGPTGNFPMADPQVCDLLHMDAPRHRRFTGLSFDGCAPRLRPGRKNQMSD